MKTLGSIRVAEKTKNNMQMSIKKYNSQNLAPVTEAEFRRIAIELLSQLILQDIPLPVKVSTK